MTNIQNALVQKGIFYFQTGQLAMAEQCLYKVLLSDPKNFDLNMLLGIIYGQQGKHNFAKDCFKKAIKSQPKDANAHFNLATALSSMGRNIEALPHFQQSTFLNPKYAEAWLNYGKCLYHMDRYQLAITCFDKAIKINSNYLDAFINKANTFFKLEQFDDAINLYDQIIKSNLTSAPAYFGRSLTLAKKSSFTLALSDIQSAIKIDPSKSEFWSHQGALYLQLRQYVESVESLENAISIDPNAADAFSNLGNTLHSMKKYPLAIKALEDAIRINPKMPEAWNNLATCFIALEDFETALNCSNKAFNLNPHFIEALYNSSYCLRNLKRYEEAIRIQEKALKLNISFHDLYGDYVLTMLESINWEVYSDKLSELIELLSKHSLICSPFALLSLIDSPELQLKISRESSESISKFITNLGPISPKPKNKLRIGYFSPDFREHPVSYLTYDLFSLHDRSKFEVIAFSLTRENFNDKVTNSLKTHFDKFIDVSDMLDSEIATLARDMEIDVAIDLAGHTKNSRMGIFAYRAAPVQISYLGFPGTVGASFIDYIIGDTTTIPDEYRKFYSEKIIYLPNSFQFNSSSRSISNKYFSRNQFELPKDGFIFCCFNNEHKVNPYVFNSWAKILSETDNSFLWILSTTPERKIKLLELAHSHGISSNRFIFANRLPVDEYLARYRLADLFLDTLPFNAGTTASDALWAGLPLITQMGKTYSARMAGSLLNALGLNELICKTNEEYENLAIELCQNHSKLASVKSKLLKAISTSSLFNSKLTTQYLEESYKVAFETYINNLTPKDIYIS